MLRRLRHLLGKQRLIPGVGEFKETLAQAMFWGTIINGAMIAGTFYFTTLRHIAPWFRLPLFVAVAVVLVVVILVIEFKFVVPSIWAFRGRQMDLRTGNPSQKSTKPITVAVSGGFDPLNGLGHLTHIQDARKLGDRLVVILSRDDQLIAKKNKPDGTFYPGIVDRMAIIRELQSVDEVVVNIDRDGSCGESLKMVRPQIFAKGGDRGPDNMPENELAICREMGCKIVYNVGALKETSSSELARGGRI